MRIFNKKGVAILFVLFELMMVLFVSYTVIKIAQSYGSGEDVQTTILAKDMKVMVDMLVATPGDVVVEYPGSVSDYAFSLSQSAVSVWAANLDFGEGSKITDDLFKVKREFSLPLGFTSSGTVSGKEKICFEKLGNAIMLKECGS